MIRARFALVGFWNPDSPIYLIADYAIDFGEVFQTSTKSPIIKIYLLTPAG